VNQLVVSESFFETLGVKPIMGSDCSRKENHRGFIVSNRFWRNELMQKRDAVGSLVSPISESPFPIVGIMPENFHFPYNTDIWRCVSSGSVSVWAGPGTNMQVIGRLRPGISSEGAAKELQTIGRDSFFLEAMQGNVKTISGPLLQSLQIDLYGDQRPMLKMLGASAALFLALVCVGVVNLLITQGAQRKQEIATRLIYGATRRGLVFQMLRETLPLVVLGGLAGLWLSEIASAWMFAQMPALHGGTVNVPVKIAFWLALVMAITFIGGLVPSLYATSLDLNTYLKTASGGKRRFLSARELLVGVQLGLALALLIGMGVLLRSMMFNVEIPVGWSSRDIIVVTIEPQRSNAPQLMLFSRDIRHELRAIPGVMSAGYMFPIPFSTQAGLLANRPIFKNPARQNVIRTNEKGDMDAIFVNVSPEGFDTMGIPIVVGRYFTELDVANNAEPRGYQPIAVWPVSGVDSCKGAFRIPCTGEYRRPLCVADQLRDIAFHSDGRGASSGVTRDPCKSNRRFAGIINYEL